MLHCSLGSELANITLIMQWPPAWTAEHFLALIAKLWRQMWSPLAADFRAFCGDKHCPAGARGLDFVGFQHIFQRLRHTLALSAEISLGSECYWESSEHEQFSVALFKSVSLLLTRFQVGESEPQSFEQSCHLPLCSTLCLAECPTPFLLFVWFSLL